MNVNRCSILSVASRLDSHCTFPEVGYLVRRPGRRSALPNEAALPACCGWIWPQIHAKESRGWRRNGCRYRSSSGSPPWPACSTPASRRGLSNSVPGCSSPAAAAPSPVGCAAGRDYKRYYTLRGHERDAVELTLLTDLHRELQHASTEGYCMTYTEYQPEASARVPLPYRNGIAASLTDASG